MNIKAFTFLLSLMLGVICFVIGLALAPAMTSVTHDAMNSTMLNCSDTPLSTMESISCTEIDTFPLLIIGLCFGIAGAIIGGML